MERVDPYDWEGDVTAENRERVKRVLQERMSTRYIAVGKHELFSAEDLVEGDYIVLRPFHNSIKQSISELKLAKDIVFKLIEKWFFSRFCSLYLGVFSGSLKSFLGVTKWPLVFTKESVAIVLVYGRKTKEYKMVVIE
jgi:hypothetical protein